MNAIEDELQIPKDYAGFRAADTLEIFKLYVDIADREVSRRERVNSLFATLNAALIAGIGYVNDPAGKLLGGTAGVLLSLTWFALIWSYGRLIASHYQTVYAMENLLPIKPFTATWRRLTTGEISKHYLTRTSIERFIPAVFFIVHVAIMLWGVSG